ARARSDAAAALAAGAVAVGGVAPAHEYAASGGGGGDGDGALSPGEREALSLAVELARAAAPRAADGAPFAAPATYCASAQTAFEWTGDATVDQVCSSRIAVSLIPGNQEALVVPQAPKGHSGTIRAEVTWLMRMLTQATPRLVATLENPKIASIPGGQVKLDVDVSVAEQSSWTGRAASWGGQLERHLTDLTKASLAEDLAVDAGWVCMDLAGLGGDLGLPAGSLAMKPLRVRVERSVLDGLEITAPVQNLDAVVILEDSKGRTLEKHTDSFPGRVTVEAGQCGCDQFVRVRPRKEDPYKRHVAFGPKPGTDWAQAQGLRVVFGVPGGGIPTFVETSEVPAAAAAQAAADAYTRLVKTVYTTPVTAVMPRVGFDGESLAVSLKRGATA
ncbi:MAG: hypothetical protein VX938_05070, partial [Myxococcota bacterium]|nr:hypothetical protein [Myxococcota bacterium]